jgi:hypothetical protein
LGTAVRLAVVSGIASLYVASVPTSAAAQYFGRNKVQYRSFDFRTMHTAHFDIYYYPAESVATADAARMAERWYARHSVTLDDEFSRRSVILYADAPSFQQTNVIGDFISQGTGGVTEPLRSRAVLPFTGSYADFDHVLGHELVHVFQFDVAGNLKGGNGMVALNRLPLWLIEGMAEYLSLGRDDPNTAMWLRDAALTNQLPTIKQLTTDPRFFPYRYGQALWAYIGGRWGDAVIPVLYRAALRTNWDRAVAAILGVTTDTLSEQWRAAIRSTYLPTVQGRTVPDSTGERVLKPVNGPGAMDVAPVLSPDGRFVAFFTTRGLLSTDLYVADAQTGKIVKKLTSPNANPHFDAISFINSAGAWSPDGKKFAFIVFADGVNEIAIFDVDSRKTEKQLHFKGVGAINDVSWGPDDRLVFSGLAGGLSDIYVYDLKNDKLDRLTHDRYAHLQPAWSPDGRSIAYATDSGPRTSFEQLTYGPMQIAIRDMETGETRLLPLFQNAKNINPQYSPDGRSLYFISDRGGIPDIYRVELATGEISQVTHIATGVSGITALSPALSVARESGRLTFSVFTNAGYAIRRLEASEAQGAPVTSPAGTVTVAGILPPVNIPEGGAVTKRVNDPATGLPPITIFPTSPYRPSLSLEYLGSPGVGIGVATGPAGGVFAGGGIAAYFSDMLGNDVLGAQIAGGGDIRNFGGQVIYQDLSHRWNWGVGLSHIPFITLGARVLDTAVSVGGGQQAPAQIIEQAIQRTYYETLSAMTQYPFSMTRRVEFNAGFSHVSYGGEVDRFLAVGNQIVGTERTGLTNAPPSLNYAQVGAALVGDYSYFGFTSPIAGGRYRFEVDPTFGQLQLQNVLADYRRYLFMRPVTFAFRGVHYARYGRDADANLLFPLFLGDQALVRGYEYSSFSGSECTGGTAGTCPVFDRLIGSKLAVVNAELRIPLLGSQQFGLINFPYLPTEISPFFDAGVAWTGSQSPTLEFARNSLARVPVFSTGVSARVNLLGYAVLEFYYVYPFQRPNEGWHFGFQVAPGW